MKKTVIPLLGTATDNPLVVKQLLQAAIETGADDVLQDPTLWRADAIASAMLHEKPAKPEVKASDTLPIPVVDDVAGGRRPVRHSNSIFNRRGG